MSTPLSPTRRIVILHTDAQTHDMLSCSGSMGFRTPNLDRLAARGVLFRQAYACNGVCVPSRASLMTGRYPLAHGVMNNHMTLHPSEPRMGRLFRNAGFETGYFGKTHYGNNNSDMPDEGWNQSFLVSDYNAFLKENGCPKRFPEKQISHRIPMRFWQAGPTDIPDELYFEKVLTDKALEFIDQNQDQKFLCFLSMVAPHAPFTPPERFLRMFSKDSVPLRPRHPQELDNKPKAFQRWVRQNREYLTEEELRNMMIAMMALVALVDEQVGRVLDFLENKGILDETLIVFTSDHGDFSSAYGIIGKSWCMDDLLLRIPLIVSGPGGASGKESRALVQNCDILPFLLESAGIPCPQKIQGKSFRTVFSDPSTKHRNEVFACQSNAYSQDHLTQSMIVSNGWKYVESHPDIPQLYNLEEDPLEWNNLAQDPDRQAQVIAMREKLLQWHLEVSGGFFQPEIADYWEDVTAFYDKTRFTGERVYPRKLSNGQGASAEAAY